jgi:DNA repair exonuclease SbcCD ATPase subunit
MTMTRFPDTEEFPALANARARLAELETQAEALGSEATAAHAAAAAASARVEDLEAKLLIGESTEADIAEARTQAQAALQPAACATRLQPVKNAIGLLKARIPTLEAEARAWVMQSIDPAYRDAVTRMKKAYAQLEAANAEVLTIYQAAAEKFGRDYSPGAFPEAGGLTCFAQTLFQDTVGAFASPSVYKQWTAKVEEYLTGGD